MDSRKYGANPVHAKYYALLMKNRQSEEKKQQQGLSSHNDHAPLSVVMEQVGDDAGSLIHPAPTSHPADPQSKNFVWSFLIC